VKMAITLEIAEPRSVPQFLELEKFVGSGRLYQKGTNHFLYVDFQDLGSAQLMMVNLNAGGYKARVMSCRP